MNGVGAFRASSTATAAVVARTDAGPAGLRRVRQAPLAGRAPQQSAQQHRPVTDARLSYSPELRSLPRNRIGQLRMGRAIDDIHIARFAEVEPLAHQVLNPGAVPAVSDFRRNPRLF